MPRLDFRSDTVTQPTAAMRQAMARAEVGDLCWGDDPTVLALEADVAQRLGKDAAVFLPSGTMANQIAVHVHCRPGDTIATHPGAHLRIHEDASAAALSGAQIMPIGTRDGYRTTDLEALIAEESCGWPPVRLVWLENTLGDAGGAVWPVEAAEAIAAWARARERATHLDGARLWNAHVATGVPLTRLAAVGDSVSVALSKGLGSPAGSVLAGTEAFAVQARRFRHAFGGGMRQAGVLAAAGLHALEHHLDRLAEDHARAVRLATAIEDLPGLQVRTPATNLVIARVTAPLTNAEALCGPLRDAGLACYPNVAQELRLAVHLGIDDSKLDEAIAILRRVVPDVVAKAG